MILIVTLDNENGRMFNKRRQSRAAFLCEDIMEITKGKKVFMTPYSYPLFESFKENLCNIVVCENPLEEAGTDDYCFAEDIRSFDGKKFDKIVIYRWNRKYPGDVFFDVNMNQYSIRDTVNFVGNSHEKITREIYDAK